MSKANTKCGGCGKFLTGGAVCTLCKSSFHKTCVNLGVNQPLDWRCPGCIAKMPRVDNADTPVKGVSAPASEQLIETGNSFQVLDKYLSEPGCATRKPNDDGDSQRAILEELRALRKEMSGFRKDFGCFREEVREEIKDLRGLYQGCENRMEGFEVRLDKQESKLSTIETLSKEASVKATEDLKAQIFELKQELGFKEQLALQNDVEITGITEEKGESVMHITGKLLNKIGLNVDERDIVEVRRVGPVRLTEDGKQQPRPIVMRVTRRAVREEVLSCARTRRNITTADIGVAGNPRSIYINERLTKNNRQLFGRAKTLCKQHKWSYVWTREGNILIREGEGKPIFRIRNDRDLARYLSVPAID